MKAANYFTKIQLKNLNGKTDLISEEIIDLRTISFTKKKQAEEAIMWLLSKAPHSVEEIADHFCLSPDLVKHILDPLVAKLAVVEESQLRYSVSNQKGTAH
ncbi:MAG: transposase family protein [Thermincola sp.]|jgi:predicted transcriptional regulator|nr:transposase family protein [Thermincola sp.]MDT3704974.1 transposase family protein [Thermincola sp.]